MRQSRLRRFTVPMEDQLDSESVKLWRKVSRAIEVDDQQAATDEKTFLEEAQRAGARERKALGREWIPKHFELVNTVIGKHFEPKFLNFVSLRTPRRISMNTSMPILEPGIL